jgi:hypothetical protein
MALELRRTGYNDGAHPTAAAYHIVERETVIGRIYQSNSVHLWLWTVYSAHSAGKLGGAAASLDEARRRFKRAWEMKHYDSRRHRMPKRKKKLCHAQPLNAA